MIANNIFKAIGDFFTNVAFAPFDTLYNMNWWSANLPSWIFIIITFVAFFYWMGQLLKFKKEGRE
ncbi:DUF6341 family protein [Aureivirga marina]|uniref:DUF6341 family protein n=1 Tax=Aureivirga marina TaxID=1182451 RepID=UPI0018C8DCCE|nr:uracil phosphoribosyltransferase [Aureivirga marina]